MRLVVLFFLLSSFLYSQTPLVSQGGSVVTIVKTKKQRGGFDTSATINLTPGRELRIASNHFFIGAGSFIIGSAAASGLFYADYPGAAIGVGATGCLVGLGFMLESHIHIRRAGILLDEKGIGIAYRF